MSDLAAMGSHGMFQSELCYICSKSIPMMYPTVRYCVPCDARIRRTLVLDKIDFGLAVEEQFRQDLAELLVYDERRRQQLHYLWCLLLAQRSPFRKFTYYSNGMAGNISEAEDVLDRILGFLK